MLMWMMLDERLNAYVRRGRIQPHTNAGTFFAPLARVEGKSRDELVRENYDPELAEKLIGKEFGDRIEDDPIAWDESEDPHLVSVGFFMWADERDWELGTLKGTVPLENRSVSDEVIFWDYEDHLSSAFDHAGYDFELSGLCFETVVVEMLLPTHRLDVEDLLAFERVAAKRPIGRPPKWHWEGVLEHLISVAQMPDGLPAGPGSQAAIEKMVSEWFLQTENASPSESQIRGRMQRIMQTLEKGGRTF
jgi:hypothetical protein